MIPLETIQIAKPCRADWNEMTGDAQVRHCGSCRLNVYNLSEMTRAQAEAVVLEHEGHLCVRFYTRADGTVLTRDCPVGLRAFRINAARRLSWAAALAVACLTGLWRGETARAVTPITPKVSAQAPSSKAAVPPSPFRLWRMVGVTFGPPQPTMGAPIAVAPVGTRKASTPAKPHATPPSHPVMMGKPALPPHGWTMGAPPPPKPAKSKK